MTSSRALELAYKLELKGDSCKQLDVTNCLGSCPIAKADIISILKDYARMKDAIDKERENCNDDLDKPHSDASLLVIGSWLEMLDRIEGKKGGNGND